MGQKFRRNRSILLRFRDKHVFVFNAEIQEGRQKWQENEFCKMSPIKTADILHIKNFVEINLSHSVSDINGFLRLTQKFKMASKSAGKRFFGKSPVDSADTLWVKNFIEIALSRTVSKINTFYV